MMESVGLDKKNRGVEDESVNMTSILTLSLTRDIDSSPDKRGCLPRPILIYLPHTMASLSYCLILHSEVSSDVDLIHL